MISDDDLAPRLSTTVYCRLIAILALLTIPWIAYGVVGTLKSTSNDPRQWLPRGFAETLTYQWLQDQFGNDEMTVVSWPGCDVTDPRAEQLAEALLVDPNQAYFQRAITGGQMLDRLRRPPLELSRREAVDRLQGVMIGPDGHTSCVLLTVSDRGKSDRKGAISEIYRVAQEAVGLDPSQLRLGGPTVDGAAIDVESRRMLVGLAVLCGTVALAVTWLRLRSLRLSLLILVVAVYSTMTSLAVVYYTGGYMNLTMTMLPALVFVLTVSAAIHLINYYREALLATSVNRAPWQALHDGWTPCTLASMTTAIGLASLAVSQIIPVRMFGSYAAAGMITSLLSVLVLLPVGLAWWRPSQRDLPRLHQEAIDHRRIDRWVRFVCRYDRMIVVGLILLMLFAGVGLTRLRSTVSLHYRFGAHSRILQDYRWLEEHLGPLAPLELVLHFNDVGESSILPQLNQVQQLDQLINDQPGVGATLSAATFVPQAVGGTGVRRVVREAVLRRSGPILAEQLRVLGMYAVDEQPERLWRISVRTSALSHQSNDQFIDQLKEVVDPFVAQLEGARVTYTGVLPLMYKAQRSLLQDLINSFLLAFGLISLVMLLVLRDVRSALLAMLPNLFPAVVIFGLMGWGGMWIEIGTILTASAAMGIAVDDTLHLLTWYRRGMQTHASRASIRFALRRCASAMVLTTMVCASSMLVFSASTFMPIRRFSWLMAILLVVALIGDLVLLPAILSSPLGRYVSMRQRRGGGERLEDKPAFSPSESSGT